MMKMARKNGQSLLEAVVALAVAMLVILALVWVTTVSIRNADFAKKQSQASSYAQEGMENIRVFRDAGWTEFWNVADGVDRGLIGTPPPSGVCATAPPVSGTNFKRCVKLEQILDGDGNGDPNGVDDDKVKATLTVSWTDSVGTHKSEQISYFTKWQ